MIIGGGEGPKDPEPGNTSIRMGAAVLRPHGEEKGHYALWRPMVIVRNEGGKITREQLEQEVGPLAIYRVKGKGDKKQPDLRTSDPKTGQPMDLIEIWRPAPKEDVVG